MKVINILINKGIKKRLLFNKIFLIIALMLFKMILDVNYVFIVSRLYDYLGFTLDINWLKLVESYGLLLLMGGLLPSTTRKPSNFLVLLLFSTITIPVLSIFALKDESREFLYMLLFSFFVIAVVSNIPGKLNIKSFPFGRYVVITTCCMFTFLVFLWILAQGGGSYFNLNLKEVYSYRGVIESELFYGGLGYIKHWMPKVIMPVLITWSLWRKYWLLFFIMCGAQIAFFGFTAHKAFLFYPLLILFIYFFGKKTYCFQIMLLGLSVVAMISMFVYYVADIVYPASLFVRRLFFVIAENHYVYFDFFKEVQFVKFSNSVLSGFFSYPFDLTIPRVVSEYRFGHINNSTNTGFLAYGYLHLGFWGMIFYSTIIGLIFKITDNIVESRIPIWVGISIMIVPVWCLRNTDLTITMWTNGLLFSLICLWLIISRR